MQTTMKSLAIKTAVDKKGINTRVNTSLRIYIIRSLLAIVLLCGLGVTVKGQGLEIKAISSSNGVMQRLNERLEQSEEKYTITARGIGEKQGPRKVKVIHLTSDALLGELTNLQHEKYLISAEVLVIDVERGQSLRVTPETLALFRSLKYIYLRIERESSASSISSGTIQSYFVGFESEEGEEPIRVFYEAQISKPQV